MTVGDKIKKIRTFRGMTQKELGLAVGFEEKGADNRIAQYETNYRVPKRELLDKIAEALRVDRQNFYTIAPGSAEDFMRTFFWLDEDSPGAIRLFQLVRNPGRAGAADDTAVRYNDGDDWPAHPPVGMYFQYGVCTSSTALWTSLCGNGFCASRSYTPGRSPGTSILNGNSTGPIPAMTARKASIISPGGKINKTSKKPPC